MKKNPAISKTSWEELRRELLTKEELAENGLLVKRVGKLIEAREKKENKPNNNSHAEQ